MFHFSVGLLAAVLTQSTGLARQEVPLGALNTELVQQRLRILFENQEYKSKTEQLLKIKDVTYTIKYTGVKYEYVNKAPRLIWVYQSPTPLNPVQEAEVKKALLQVLSEGLTKLKASSLTPLLTEESFKELAHSLVLVWEAPAAGNSSFVLHGPTSCCEPSPCFAVPRYHWSCCSKPFYSTCCAPPATPCCGSLHAFYYSPLYIYPYYYPAYFYPDYAYYYPGRYYPAYYYSPAFFYSSYYTWRLPMAAASGPTAGTVATSAPINEKVLSRDELLKGRTASDWALLYDAGYRAYWSGKYLQAVEYCAAAIQLGDDPRGWYYLSLSLMATGDNNRALAAGRYAAAKTLIEPEHAAEVQDAISRVQGPLRDKLTWIGNEVGTPSKARDVIASRSRLLREELSATGLASNK